MAADGTPRVRTLVFRGWAGSTALEATRMLPPQRFSHNVPEPFSVHSVATDCPIRFVDKHRSPIHRVLV